MKDEDIQVFIASARRYFHSVDATSPLVVDPPFIRPQVGPFLGYTGIITISGKARGVVCFTADRDLLRLILAKLHDEGEGDEAAIRDLVGEIANTLSGNAREEFGKDFLITVPVVITGDTAAFPFPRSSRSYAVPLTWRDHRAYLLVTLE